MIFMNTKIFIIITFITGIISGLIYALSNLILIEPYIDKAIDLEIERLVMEGESVDLREVEEYRIWQKGGSVFAAIILSTAYSSIFAIVYAYSRKGLNGSEVKRGVIISSILWIVIFLVPFIKYPANPPAVGDPTTIYYREALYLAILGISGSTSLFLAYISRIKRIRFALPFAYATIIALAYMALPNNPDEITISIDLINSFRIVSVIASLITWVSLGVIFGILYQRFNKVERLT